MTDVPRDRRAAGESPAPAIADWTKGGHLTQPGPIGRFPFARASAMLWPGVEAHEFRRRRQASASRVGSRQTGSAGRRRTGGPGSLRALVRLSLPPPGPAARGPREDTTRLARVRRLPSGRPGRPARPRMRSRAAPRRWDWGRGSRSERCRASVSGAPTPAFWTSP